MKYKILKFGAKWCGPCKVQDRVLEAVKANLNIPVMLVDVDENPELASKYKIQSIPTTFVLDEKDNIIHKFTGVVVEDKLVDLLA